jgi:hypothetical protein
VEIERYLGHLAYNQGPEKPPHKIMFYNLGIRMTRIREEGQVNISVRGPKILYRTRQRGHDVQRYSAQISEKLYVIAVLRKVVISMPYRLSFYCELKVLLSTKGKCQLKLIGFTEF